MFAKPCCRIAITKAPEILFGAFAILLIALAQLLGKKPSEIPRQLIAPPAGMERFVFGYQEVTADAMWIRSIQDFDYCDAQIAKNTCRNNSWLYLMLESITNLSPSFRIPYAAGALALTVIISDIEGATKIFDKGVKAFPNDWPIAYRAAYHYLYELKDKERAAELLRQAARNGAPPWLYSLSGRLYSESGEHELAESLLQEMVATNQDPEMIKRLREKIESFKKKPSR